MKEPSVLLRPEMSMDKGGSISFPLASGVTIVDGQYGQAWSTGENYQRMQFNSFLEGDEGFTLLIRMRRALSVTNAFSSFYLDGWTSDNAHNELYAGDFAFYYKDDGESRYDYSSWDDYETNYFTFTDTSVWTTFAFVVTPDYWRVYDNGNLVASGEHTLLKMFRPHSFDTHRQSITESVLFFNDPLTENEVRYVSRLQEAWTWENVQIKQPSSLVVQAVESGGVVPSISGYRLIPKLYKADRHNVLGEDITEYVRKGVVEYNPDRTTKMTFNAEVDAEGVLTPFSDFLAPFLTVEYDDGHTVTSQLGLYTFVPPKQTINQHHRRASIDGRDLTWILSVSSFDQGYSVAAGTNVVTAVETVLSDAGFTRFSIQQSSRTLTSARSWKAGTSRLEVINDLLTSAGYYSLYCLKDGRFASMPYRSIVNPSIAVDYDTTKGSYVQLVGQVALDTTPDRIANKIVLIKESSNEAPIVAVAKNTNPQSPVSIPNIGYEISKNYTSTNVLDQASADLLATQLLEEASQQYNKVTINTFPDVLREPTNEVYRLNIVDSGGDVVLDGVWRCRGWRIGFEPGDKMTHELSNIDTPPMEV